MKSREQSRMSSYARLLIRGGKLDKKVRNNKLVAWWLQRYIQSIELAIKRSRVRLHFWSKCGCVTTLGKLFTPVYLDAYSLRYYYDVVHYSR